MSKRVLCKFFANGACLKGEHCEYAHDWKATPNDICTFYKKGLCAYGSRCRYQHVKASRPQSTASSTQCDHSSSSALDGIYAAPGSVSSVPFVVPKEPVWKSGLGHSDFSDNGDVDDLRDVGPGDHPICSFAAAGDCPRGDKCPHIHGDLCPTCGKHCLHPFRSVEREDHLRTCEKKHKHLESLKHSQEIECCVCLDRVLSKPTAAERKFGLLSECDHPFCISCIRNWRSTSPVSGMDVNSALRSCPICRKLSYYVVPSVIWYTTKEEKEEIVDSYKSKLKSIDCRHFDFGNGSCPFGTSCFYKHTVKPGSYMWKYHRPPPRRPVMRRSNVDDEIHGVIEMLEYFDEMYNYAPEDLDEDDLDLEDLSPLQMGLLFSELGFDNTSDLSSDEDFIL